VDGRSVTAAWGVIGVGYFSTFSFGNPTLFKEKKKNTTG